MAELHSADIQAKLKDISYYIRIPQGAPEEGDGLEDL